MGARENSKTKIFSGIQFILTKGTRYQQLEQDTDVYVSSEIEMEKEENVSKKIDQEKTTFHRNQIKEIIENNGGVVIQDIPSISSFDRQSNSNNTPSKAPNIVLLSNQYCQTMSFLLGIAYGCTRLSYKWVVDSKKEGKLVSMEKYYLPTGWSMTEDRIIQQNESNNEEKYTNGIFDKLHILIA